MSCVVVECCFCVLLLSVGGVCCCALLLRMLGVCVF